MENHRVERNSGGGLWRGPPSYVAMNPWPAGRALLAGLLIVAMGILAAGLLATILAADGRAPVPGTGRGRLATPDATVLVMLGAWQVVVVALVLVVSRRHDGHVRRVLALGAPAGGPAAYVQAVLLLAALQAVLAAVQHYVIAHDMYADLRPFVKLVVGRDWPLALAAIGVGAPLAEELLFRGFLLSALAQTRLRFWGAAVATSALWTALHWDYSAVGIAEVFTIGIFFSWLLWRTGSLRVPIFCHALYNSLIVIILRFVPLPG